MTRESTESESKTLRNVALTGCLGCAGLVVLAAIGVSLLFFWGKSTIGNPARDFIDALDAGDYERAYALTAGEWRGGKSLEEFERAYAALRHDLGARRSIRSVGFQFNGRVTHPSEGGATYSAEYEGGKVLIEVSLARGEESWHVTDAHYRRRVSKPLDVCPYCGGAVESSDEYCSHCGKPLRQPPEDTPETAPDDAPEEGT